MLTALALALSFALLPFVAPADGYRSEIPLPASDSRAHYLMAPSARTWSGAVLFGACGGYCVWLWSGGRRTLPMKTWRLGLRTSLGHAVAPSTALVRFVACGIGPALTLAAYVALQPSGHSRWALWLLSINYAWALVDPERQFLQDRIAGTRLIVETTSRD